MKSILEKVLYVLGVVLGFTLIAGIAGILAVLAFLPFKLLFWLL